MLVGNGHLTVLELSYIFAFPESKLMLFTAAQLVAVCRMSVIQVHRAIGRKSVLQAKELGPFDGLCHLLAFSVCVSFACHSSASSGLFQAL